MQKSATLPLKNPALDFSLQNLRIKFSRKQMGLNLKLFFKHKDTLERIPNLKYNSRLWTYQQMNILGKIEELCRVRAIWEEARNGERIELAEEKNTLISNIMGLNRNRIERMLRRRGPEGQMLEIKVDWVGSGTTDRIGLKELPEVLFSRFGPEGKKNERVQEMIENVLALAINKNGIVMKEVERLLELANALEKQNFSRRAAERKEFDAIVSEVHGDLRKSEVVSIIRKAAVRIDASENALKSHEEDMGFEDARILRLAGLFLSLGKRLEKAGVTPVKAGMQNEEGREKDTETVVPKMIVLRGGTSGTSPDGNAAA